MGGSALAIQTTIGAVVEKTVDVETRNQTDMAIEAALASPPPPPPQAPVIQQAVVVKQLAQRSAALPALPQSVVEEIPALRALTDAFTVRWCPAGSEPREPLPQEVPPL